MANQFQPASYKEIRTKLLRTVDKTPPTQLNVDMVALLTHVDACTSLLRQALEELERVSGAEADRRDRAIAGYDDTSDAVVNVELIEHIRAIIGELTT